MFHHAAVSLLDLDYAASVTYADWQQWNEASNGAKNPPIAGTAEIAAAGEAFWEGRPADVQLKLNYFCRPLRLHEPVRRFAATGGTGERTKIPDDWNRLLDDLKGIVFRDVNTDFAKPAVAAILKLCAAKRVSYDRTVCGPALTCTVSLMSGETLSS